MLLDALANLVYKFRPWRRQDIEVNGALYLRRTCLCSIGPLFIYLHKFITGDAAEALHTHPFYMFSVILRGGYVEETPGGGRRMIARWNWITPDTEHKIQYTLHGTWSLCFGWRVRDHWFFRDAHGNKVLKFTSSEKWKKPK